MIDAGADMYEQGRNLDGRTFSGYQSRSLHIAAHNGDAAMIRMLLESEERLEKTGGRNVKLVETTVGNYETAPRVAAAAGWVGVDQQLVEAGAPLRYVMNPCEYQMSPVFAAPGYLARSAPTVGIVQSSRARWAALSRSRNIPDHLPQDQPGWPHAQLPQPPRHCCRCRVASPSLIDARTCMNCNRRFCGNCTWAT